MEKGTQSLTAYPRHFTLILKKDMESAPVIRAN
jgi:hypothetical protein